MSNPVQVTNTLAFVFPAGAAQPNLAEMARFVKTLATDTSDMQSAYKISDERSVFVKFTSEAAMNRAIKRNPRMHTFHYSNGKVVEICMTIAGSNVRYVRIFDLPPEVPDLEVSIELEKFGKVKYLEREKFPADLGLGELYTGVRGIHMDVKKDIPPILRFLGRKGRIYYEDMKLKCYVCFSEGHLKAACPNKKVVRTTNRDPIASTAGGAAPSDENEETGILEDERELEQATTEKERETDNVGIQNNKGQHQQQKQTMPHFTRKPLKSGSWTECVQQYSTATKEQQKSNRSTAEASPPVSPPRKNLRSGSSSRCTNSK